jgi:hypothetical protein
VSTSTTTAAEAAVTDTVIVTAAVEAPVKPARKPRKAKVTAAEAAVIAQALAEPDIAGLPSVEDAPAPEAQPEPQPAPAPAGVLGTLRSVLSGILEATSVDVADVKLALEALDAGTIILAGARTVGSTRAPRAAATVKAGPASFKLQSVSVAGPFLLGYRAGGRKWIARDVRLAEDVWTLAECKGSSKLATEWLAGAAATAKAQLPKAEFARLEAQAQALVQDGRTAILGTAPLAA